MPSRFSYWRTADGFLEKKEAIDPTLSQPLTPQLAEDGFKIESEDKDPWPKVWDTAENFAPEMDGFSAQTIDTVYEKMLLENAPIDEDDTWPSPMTDDIPSACSDSIVGDPKQDHDGRSYFSHPLSLAEIRELQDIAMPQYIPCNADRAGEINSSDISESDVEVRAKKRKSSKIGEAAEARTFRQTRKQQGHNAIEKRYRSGLNDKINTLRQRLPSLCTITEGLQTDKNAEDGELSPTVGQKYGKAEVLTGAVAYISHLEGTVDRLGGDIALLKARIMAFERLAMSGSIMMGHNMSQKACAAETLQTVPADFGLTNQGIITTAK